MNHIVFREIDPNHYGECYEFNLLHEYSFRDSFAGYKADDEETRKSKTDRIVETLKNVEGKFYCLAAFDKKKMIGMIFQNRMEMDKMPACHIHGLWVHEDYRKKGIGRTLKEMGELWARSKGCVFMDTNVRVTNAAMRSLNESLGYEVARFNYRKKI